MLTVEDVSFKCIGRNTFARGQLIYKVKNVNDFKTENTKEQNKILVKARVKGSNIEDFDTEALVNERTGDVERAECSCLAYSSYAGLCKHCVAMLLEYIDRRDGNEISVLPVARRYTDDGFESIMEKFVLSKRVEYIQPEITGKLQIVPELFSSGNALGVAFKIGIHNFYVIKNLRNFASEVKNIEKVKYGKNLEFYNTISAYSEKSRNLVRFIMACEEGDSIYSPMGGGSSGGLKNIILKHDILDEFINLIRDEPIIFEEDGYEKRKIWIKDGVSQEKLRIQGVEDGIVIHTNRQKLWYGRRYGYMLSGNVIYRMERELCEQLESFIRYGNAYVNTGIFVSGRELPVFVRDMLPELKKIYEIETDNFNELQYKGKKAEFKIYLDAPEKNMITCRVLAFYGEDDKGINIFDKEIREAGRDITGETMTAGKIYGMFNAFDPEEKCPVLSNDDEKLFYLLTEGIEILKKLGEVFVSDSIKKIKVSPAPKVQLGISLKGDFLEMSIADGEMPLEQLAEILSRYDRKKKYYRLKNGDFIRTDNEEIAVFAAMNKNLQIGSRDIIKGRVKIPKYRSLYMDASLSEFTTIQYDYDVGFRRLVENIRNLSDYDVKVPEEMEGVLREYQKEGFIWLRALKDHGFGAVLADEMGLGKTLQVIALLLSCREEKGPSIIICPASLVYNWKSEIERFAPSLETVLVSGNVQTREEIIRNIRDREVVITSYDLLKRDVEFYGGLCFNCQIIDEAQYIKNHNTQVAKAVKSIKSGFRAALTGTPVENRLSELWSIFDFIMPGFLYHYSRFREEIETPVVVRDDRERLEFLQKMIGPFVLRRLKSDVLKFLPDKIEKNMYAKMEGEQWEIYQAHVQRMKILLDSQSEEEFRKSKIQILSELTKLRQICCNPALIYEKYGGTSAKTVMCMELIKNAVEGGHKVLVFSQFTTMLEVLEEGLGKEKIKFLTLTGASSKEKRARMVEEFNYGEVPVFCISLKAGGTGLNLTAADIVIHYDPWWNAAVQNQATDRAHRIGQEKIVTVYKLIAKDSIEEGIVELQDKKKELADQILGGGSVACADFTKEQLLELLE